MSFKSFIINKNDSLVVLFNPLSFAGWIVIAADTRKVTIITYVRRISGTMNEAEGPEGKKKYVRI